MPGCARVPPRALAEIGPDAKGAVPALADALRDIDPDVREAAATALGEIGPDAAGAVRALTVAVRDPKVEVREAAIFRLGRNGAVLRSSSCQSPLATPEPEADAVNGLDGVDTARRQEFRADVANMAVDGAIRDMHGAAIGGFQNLLAAEYLFRTGKQRAHDGEFNGGQHQGRVRETCRMRVGVHHQCPLRAHARGGNGTGFRALENDIDAGHEFARAEGLGDVIITADLEPQHAINFLVAGGEEENRRFRGLANLSTYFEPIALRHADVEHDEVRSLLSEASQRLGAVARRDRRHAGLLQRETDNF